VVQTEPIEKEVDEIIPDREEEIALQLFEKERLEVFEQFKSVMDFKFEGNVLSISTK